MFPVTESEELPGSVAAAYEEPPEPGFQLACEPGVGRLLAALAAAVPNGRGGDPPRRVSFRATELGAQAHRKDSWPGARLKIFNGGGWQPCNSPARSHIQRAVPVRPPAERICRKKCAEPAHTYALVMAGPAHPARGPMAAPRSGHGYAPILG